MVSSLSFLIHTILLTVDWDLGPMAETASTLNKHTEKQKLKKKDDYHAIELIQFYY